LKFKRTNSTTRENKAGNDSSECFHGQIVPYGVGGSMACLTSLADGGGDVCRAEAFQLATGADRVPFAVLGIFRHLRTRLPFRLDSKVT
jgi:hypothetical protein